MNIFLAYISVGLLVLVIRLIVSPSTLQHFTDTINRHQKDSFAMVILGVLIAIVFAMLCYPYLLVVWATKSKGRSSKK